MAFKEISSEFPEVWKPQKSGDLIEGIFKQVKENVGKNKSNLYIIDVNGTFKSVWGSTVLDDKMIHLSIGDKIRITYQGLDEEKDYKRFFVEKDEPENSDNI